VFVEGRLTGWGESALVGLPMVSSSRVID